MNKYYIMGTLMILLAIIFLPKNLCLSKNWQCNNYKLTLKKMKTMAEAIYRFQQSEGRFPTTAEKLSILTRKTDLSDVSHRKYIDRIKMDSWGNPFIYMYEETNNQTFFLYSAGINSQDEFGQGDDIVFNSKHSEHIYCQ